MTRKAIAGALQLIFQGIQELKDAFPNRAFTIDGRLVGDIGEVIAALEYDVTLDSVARKTHDGITSDGKHVQVKATFKDKLTFSSVPDYYLGFQLDPGGDYKEIFNGPGHMIFDRWGERKGAGKTLISLPIAELERLSAQVPQSERIRKRVLP